MVFIYYGLFTRIFIAIIFQECYTLLQKYGIAVTQEEVERVDTVRYLWHNLNQKIEKIVSELLLIQNKFHSSLLDNIVQFNEDCNTFIGSYSEVNIGYNNY